MAPALRLSPLPSLVLVFAALVGAAAGIGFQLASSATTSARADMELNFGPIFFVLIGIGAVVGFLVGLEKAFWLKLEAQKVLCALQTEINTRAPASSPQVPPSA